VFRISNVSFLTKGEILIVFVIYMIFKNYKIIVLDGLCCCLLTVVSVFLYSLSHVPSNVFTQEHTIYKSIT